MPFYNVMHITNETFKMPAYLAISELFPKQVLDLEGNKT